MLERIRTLSTIGFLLLIFAGLGNLAFHVLTNSDQDLSERLDTSWRSAMDGRLTGEIGRNIDKAMPNSKLLNGLIDGFVYQTLGDTGPQVREGCPGWFFLTEELVETPNGEAHLADRVKLAKAITAELARSDTALVVVPVPDKAQTLTGQEMCHLQSSAQAHKRFSEWNARSEPLALLQVNIGKNWPRPGYWKTDTHWDQHGAQHAANQVAVAISQNIGAGSTAMHLENCSRENIRPGDLVTLAGLGMTQDIFGPNMESECPVKLKIERSGGLLDDAPEPDVLLAGSSYSLNSYFHDYLQADSNREIVQKSQAGGGFAGALLDILENNPQLLRKIKLVVWEWPVRSLTLPLTEQEKRFLSKDL
ncbi:hypothetical protein AAIB41_17895 [Brucella sp. BE17]|uniref:alginate O-acetyltransferase AlgX-related protein n=1 Tax=Brucella sp. BE17 TaxID=3142977 RepID=UPI0031BB141B